MATRQILAELCGAFQQKTGQSAVIEAVGGVDAARRVRAGEAFDVVVLADDVMQQLEAEGHLEAGSRAGLAESAIAVAVRAGARRPALTDEATTKAAVLAAASIGYSTGPSGNHVLKLLERWGIRQMMADRIVKAPPGVPVGTLVARGEAELGFQQLSEFLGEPGIEIVGPLPHAVQSVTLFSCGIGALAPNAAAAQGLVDYLASPDTDAVKRRHGMEPARARS